VNDNVKIVFLLISSSKVDRFTPNQEQNDQWRIVHVSSNSLRQRKCFHFVIFVRNYPVEPHWRRPPASPGRAASCCFITAVSLWRADHCVTGEFYSRSEERCLPCARDSYQPLSGQNFCVDCPGDTQTDSEGAVHSSQCKGTTHHTLSLWTQGRSEGQWTTYIAYNLYSARYLILTPSWLPSTSSSIPPSLAPAPRSPPLFVDNLSYAAAV